MLHAPEKDLFSLCFHFLFFFYFETPNRLEKEKKNTYKIRSVPVYDIPSRDKVL